MYCSPHKGQKDAGYKRQEESDLWVCSVCDLPTRMVFEKLTDMRVPLNAKAILSYAGKANGTSIIRFALTDGTVVPVMYYRPYPTKVDMNTPRDLLCKFWKDLDDCIDQIRGLQTDATLVEAEKVKARTYAEVLAEIMSPFYDSPEAVLRESMVRWECRRVSKPHESPGLAESIWDPNTRFDGTPYSRANEERVRGGGRVAVAPKRTGNKVPENLAGQLRDAIKNGMFTAVQIGKTYNMTEAEVKEQLGLV